MREVTASEQLRAMLVEQDDEGLSSLLDRLHPVTAAGLCEELRVDEIWRLLDLAPLEQQAEVFSLLCYVESCQHQGQ